MDKLEIPDAGHISKAELIKRQKEWEEEQVEVKQIRKSIRKRKRENK